MTTLTTPRLILRPWRDSDAAPFAALNADSRVMEHFPSTLSREQSDAMLKRLRQHFVQYDYGLWAAEEKVSNQCIGFIGLSNVPFTSHFTPSVEIGWRLAYDFWHKGYATEGAEAALHYGFETLQLPEIVAFTIPQNQRSQNVMIRLGMTHTPDDDFDHPLLPEEHPLLRHVLYRKDNSL